VLQARTTLNTRKDVMENQSRLLEDPFTNAVRARGWTVPSHALALCGTNHLKSQVHFSNTYNAVVRQNAPPHNI
jgi:hypothetical protein